MQRLLWVLMLIIGLPLVAQQANHSGTELFALHCSRCHVDVEMQRRIVNDWQNRSAAELLQRITESMPVEAPGSLTDTEYLALVGHVLNLSGMRISKAQLNIDELKKLEIRSNRNAGANSSTNGINVDWRHYNGNIKAQRFSPAEQITEPNADQLKIAWQFDATSFGPTAEARYVTSPIVVDGVLYATAGVTRNFVALDAATGQLLWMWRPEEGARFAQAPRKGSGKGLAFWSDKASAKASSSRRILGVTPGYFLVSLDASTGRPDLKFGASGWVDLRKGLRLGPGREDVDIGLSFPPLVVGDVVVVGAAHQVSMRPPSASNVKGDIRGFDVRTGALLWTFKTIPEAGDPGAETWQGDSASYTGNAGVWAPMSADPELGLVYLPVESATGDRYGGDRPGANLYANSLVALEAKTGRMRWQHQLIHHDIWDWDNPSAPILVDLENGRKLVVQLTKQAFAYVYERETGIPLWPINEKIVPVSDVPGEVTSTTQPFPSWPAPFDLQGFSEADLLDFTPELLEKAKLAIKPYRLGPLFTPPSLADALDGSIGTLSVPSSLGGANWEGGAVDPSTGILYVPSSTAVGVLALESHPELSSVKYIQGNGRAPTIDGLPLVKPPWGRITAIDLNTGNQLWWIANADTPEKVINHPALAGLASIPRTGVATRSGILVTPTLLFAGEGYGGAPVFRAHNKNTGEIVAEIDLPATQTGQPITYTVDGKQFIVMSVSGTDVNSALVALALPD